MLDIKFIREHAGEVRIAITNKGIDLNLDELLGGGSGAVGGPPCH